MNSSKTILIIEDDPAIRDVISLILKERNYQHSTSDGGKDIQELLDNPQLGLVLADLNLSVNSGDNLIREIKSRHQTLPIVLLSARPDGSEIAKKTGANDFLAKPFNIDKLLGLVEKYLGKH